MSKYAVTTATGTALLLTACAQLPDVTYQYYQPKSATTLSVTQNLQCVKDPSSTKDKTIYKELDITTSIVTPLTSYSADYNVPAEQLERQQLSLKDLNGTFTDANASVTFTEDGRIASMNATLTGEGETILKSAISLGTTAATFAGVGVLEIESPAEQAKRAKELAKEVCPILAGWPNADKLALTFTRINDLGTQAQGEQISLNDPDHDRTIWVSDQDLYNFLKSSGVRLPVVTATVGHVSPNVRVATYQSKRFEGVVPLWLQDTATVRLDYKIDRIPVATNSNLVVVPLKGSDHLYAVVVPKGELFGTETVSLTLSPSGAITTLGYGKTNGAAGAMNVAAAALTAATPAATTPPPTPPPPTAPPSSPPPTH